MTEQICRVLFDENAKEVIFDSVETKGLTLSQTVEDDKRYGKMEPANGKYYTYRVLNGDIELTQKEAKRSLRYSFKRWSLYAKLSKFKPARKGEYADFRVVFHTVESDPDKMLTDNTIMYHYYPINDINNKFRGLCVVNKKYYHTTHGNKIRGTDMVGVQVQYPNGEYHTMDFDQVYAHEVGHGLGLPHDTEPGNVMSPNYSIMAEYPQVRDQSRIKMKYGSRWMPARLLVRWLTWLRYASER